MPVVIVMYSLFIEEPVHLYRMVPSHITTQCHGLSSPCCNVPGRCVKFYWFWTNKRHHSHSTIVL